MRGKVFDKLTDAPRKGITPAHAGKSHFFTVMSNLQRDHPRACGEKKLRIQGNESAQGSPPRMRGKASFFAHSSVPAGITPAHAGKSTTHCFWCKVDGDHPRACGEKTKDMMGRTDIKGSPPRMRGKECQEIPDLECSRITPAHAGKRHRWPGKRLPIQDHPRACGEK